MAKKFCVSLLLTFLFSVYCFSAPIPVGQIELGYDDVPSAYYEYGDYTAGAIINYSNVEMLRVLAPLDLDGVSYYFIPGEGLSNGDYNGDIEGDDGFIQFNRPGPYFVEITWIGGTKEYRAYAVEFIIRDRYNSKRWKKAPTPSPDVVITDPDLASSNPNFPSRPPKPPTVEVNNIQTWDQVRAYLLTLKNAHVELGGHGKPGEFKWNGKTVLNKYNLEYELNALKGHVSNLTFMACEVGADPNFIQGVADILGECSGYTTPVGGNGEDWFIADDGHKVTRYKSVTADDCAMHANVAYISPDASMLVVSGIDADAGNTYNSVEITMANAVTPELPITTVLLNDSPVRSYRW